MFLWQRRLRLLLRLAVIVFAVVSTFAWHRSYRTADALVRVNADRQYTRLVSSNGVLSWQTAPDYPFDPSPSPWAWLAKTYNGTTRMIRLGTAPAWEQSLTIKDSWPMTHVIDLGGPATYAKQIRVPYAAVVLPAACAAAFWLTTSLRRRRTTMLRRQRRSRGCCARCGYDLRSTPEKCPECGPVYASL